jgi:hypothetical protein
LSNLCGQLQFDFYANQVVIKLVVYKKAALLTLLFAVNLGSGIWLPVESITNRANATDLTCRSNARGVVIGQDGNIHIAWRGNVGGIYQVWYSYWDSSNGEWSEDTVISNESNSTGDPAIGCDSLGNIYVVWITAGVLKLKCRDFSTGEWQVEDTFRTGSDRDSAVSMAVDKDGVVHLTWASLGSGEQRCVYYVLYDSGWAECDTVARLGSSSPITYPSIACTPEGNLMVVWHQQIGNVDAILGRLRVNGVWGEVETVYSRVRSVSPCVAWNRYDGTFNVVWIANYSSILWRARTVEGWGDTVRFGVWAGEKSSPSVAADNSGNLHFVWVNEDSTSQRHKQVCYQKRTNTGIWKEFRTLTEGGNLRDRVSITARMGTVQVVWSERVGTFNWAVRARRKTQARDVGVIRIELPQGVIDSGSAFVPVALIGNFGDFNEPPVPVWFAVGDSARTCFSDSIAEGDSVEVVFDSISVHHRDWVVVVCSVYVEGDIDRRNDSVRDSIFSRVQDVVAEEILTPSGRVPEGVIRPRVKVFNRGNDSARFGLVCSILTRTDSLVYNDSITITLGSNVSRDTGFRGWNAEVGDYVVRVRAVLPNDMHPENDTISSGFTVIRHDVGVSRILFPVNVVDSGFCGSPQAVIKNYGSEIESFQVLLRIGTSYCDSLMIRGLTPGDSMEATFSRWEARERGRSLVCCTTQLASDHRNDNDAVKDTFFVRVRDVGVVEITSPGVVVNPGEIQPEALVHNFGNEVAGFCVRCEIYDSAGMTVYLDSVEAMIAPECSSLVSFGHWQARGGRYSIWVSAMLNGDMRKENDSISKKVRVMRRDGGLIKIEMPKDTVPEGVVEPVAVVGNYGEESADMWVYFAVSRIRANTDFEYIDSSRATVEPGAQREVCFRQWQATPGLYLTFARCNLQGDENPGNDSVNKVVAVESILYRQWKEELSVPAGVKNLPVRAGGCLVATNDKVFALKGRTDEWYFFDVNERNWVERQPVPGGIKGRKPKGGAAVCWDGRSKIYLLKGGNTREFWCYDLTLDSWQQLPGLPDGTRNVRYGSGLAFVPKRDSGRVYCLKGSGTDDFLFYLVERGEWHARRPVPRGMLNKSVKRGSALVAASQRLFCLKGSTNEFYEYLISRDSWRECTSLPFTGRNGLRRAKDGAALASDGVNYIYAFKGGRTSEFWRYDIHADSWEEMEDIPKGTKLRRVGAGAGLAFSRGKVYALKGSNSREFWSFDPSAVKGCAKSEIIGTKKGKHKQEFSCREPEGLLTITSPKQPIGWSEGEVCIVDVSGRIRVSGNLEPGVYFILSKERPTHYLRIQKLILTGRSKRRF